MGRFEGTTVLITGAAGGLGRGAAATGSLEKQRSTEKATDATGPRLGISIDPWIMPSAF